MGVVAYKNPDLFKLTGRQLLPLWDEKLLLAFGAPKDKHGHQSLNPFQARDPYPFRQKRLGNVGVDDAMLIMRECLRDGQAYFIKHPAQDWRVKFPYALWAKDGQVVNNLTTGEQYSIARVFDDEEHDVLLSGKRKPRSTDRLRFEEQDQIFFNHAYPRMFSSGHKFSDDGTVADKPAPFNPTITFIVTRAEPGSVADAPPFHGTKQLKPQFREGFTDPHDPELTVSTTGWLFDNLVQFDCWAKTNAEAVKLLRWFEDFMIRHTWIFELFGVSRILYWKRDEDAEVAVWRNDITKRTVVYYFRTERVFWYQTRKLSQIKLEVDLQLDAGPVPDEFTEVIPDSSSSADWPEPTSSVDVSLVEGPRPS